MALLLRHDDVAQLVTIEVAIDAMADAFRAEGDGQTGLPGRFNVPSEHGWLRLMPVVLQGPGVFGFKAMNLTHGTGVRYAVWIYDLVTGALMGMLDARLITAMRTAASSALATRELASPEVRSTAIIGTGSEARTHLLAMQAVRPASRISVYSRSRLNRAMFVKDMSPAVTGELIDCTSVEAAVSDADLLVLATKSPEPVLSARHLAPGMHVNSIGSARQDQFELALDTFPAFSIIVCDSKSHVFAEAGDAISAVKDDQSVLDTASDLADIIVGRRPGRTNASDITLYKSVGTATQDIALGARLLELAEISRVGQDLGEYPAVKAFD